MKQFSSEKQKIGLYGENIVSLWLTRNGFSLVERNYGTRYGEIDVIAQKGNVLYFIEVKSILSENTDFVSRETQYNPAENVSREKMKRMKRTIEIFLSERRIRGAFQIDVFVVFIDKRNVKHKINRIENILLP